MKRTLLAVAVGVVIGAGGYSLARQDEHGEVKVTKLSARDINETLNGKEARVTMLEVALEPNAAGQPHRHPGPVFGYVLEGEFELGINDEPAKTLKTGETFYEPGRALHRVSRNPSATKKTKVLAVMVHPRDAKELVLPPEKE
jgi:quercetin dioxygenase-like cupin family protein